MWQKGTEWKAVKSVALLGSRPRVTAICERALPYRERLVVLPWPPWVQGHRVRGGGHCPGGPGRQDYSCDLGWQNLKLYNLVESSSRNWDLLKTCAHLFLPGAPLSSESVYPLPVPSQCFTNWKLHAISKVGSYAENEHLNESIIKRVLCVPHLQNVIHNVYMRFCYWVASDLGLVHWDGINAFFILKIAYNLKGVNFESLKQKAFADHSLLTLLLPLSRKPTVRGSNDFGHTTQRNGLFLFN